MPLHFFYSALQLAEDTAAVRLSLSPTPVTPVSPNNNHQGGFNLKRRELSVDNLPAAAAALAYMGEQEGGGGGGGGGTTVATAPDGMRRSTSWYDGFFGCLKPVWTLMGKTGKPSPSGQSTEGK